MIRALLVEDNDDDADLLKRRMSRTDFTFERAATLAEARAHLSAARFDLVLLDLSLPDSQGFTTFETIHAHAPHVALIVLTGNHDEALGLRTVQEGAQDYLVKGDVSAALMVRAARYAIERKRTEEVVAHTLDELRRKNAEMREDLKLAREVQEAFVLPHGYPACPSLHFAHRYRPAGDVGGDLFDVSRLSPELTGVLICDVMGHGVRAALITGMLRGLVAERPPAALHPARLLAQLNDGLHGILEGSDTPMFVSAFYLVVDCYSGELRWANAGHPSPLHVHAAGDRTWVEPLQTHPRDRGPVLGLSGGAVYPERRAQLTDGDRLLCFTDGVYEVDGAGGDSFGQARLQAAVARRAALPREEFLDGLVAEVHAFSDREEFDDDACFLAMDFVSARPTAAPPDHPPVIR